MVSQFAVSGQPVLRLHHIGFLVEHLDEAVEHFHGNFAYQVESPPIQDFGQAATVQFLRQPGAMHWLELVCPLGQDSKLWNAIGRGTSLHHQCYETADIQASIDRLHAAGCMPLGLPIAGAAFDGRLIAWVMDRFKGLIELVQAGAGARSLAQLDRSNREVLSA